MIVWIRVREGASVRKIGAVKAVRKQLGWGLKEAKQLIDAAYTPEGARLEMPDDTELARILGESEAHNLMETVRSFGYDAGEVDE